jgi:hypothetical protein
MAGQAKGVVANPGRMAQSRPSARTAKQARHSAKQRRQCDFVRLNSAICNAADTGADVLLEFVYQRMPEMNLVNFSTALHRLARLAEEGSIDRTPSLRDPRYYHLVEGARTALLSSEDQCKARCLSTVAWAVARLGLEHAEMMEEIAAMSLPRVNEFKPYELGILLWSYAKLQSNQTQLFEVASRHIAEHMDEFGAASLATLVWALTTSRMSCCTNLVRQAADAFALRLRPENPHAQAEKVQPVALENMMWGLATLRTQPQQQSLVIIADAALEALEDFKTHEFTIILWAFARLGFFPSTFFSEAGNLVLRSSILRNKMHPQGIANLFWAFAKYAEKNSSSQFVSVVKCLLPMCQKLLPHLKPQELGCVLSSLSELGKSWGEDAILDDIFVTAAWVGNPASHEWSLASVSKTLKAYSRFIGSRGVSIEPCSTFLSKLVCLCARFADKIDAQSALSIVETWLPLSARPEVTAALIEILVVGLCASETSRNDRHCLMRLRALADTLCRESSDACQMLGSCLDEESMSVAEGLLPEAMGMQLTGAGTEDFFECVPQGSAAPAYASFTCQSWLRPELQNFAKAVGSHGIRASGFQYEEVAHVHVPASRAWPTRLAILEEFTSTEVIGDQSTIMFEVDSAEMLIECKVDVQCYRDKKLYDTFTLILEAGREIPNTHVLNLTRLEEGQHEINFSLSTEAGAVLHEKFSFCVVGKQASQPGSFVATGPPVDVHALTNNMMKAGVFNSRGSSGGSTCFGSTSEASYDAGITSAEE